jgi:hypothetical protein
LDTPVKLLLTWDIAPDHEQDYFEFVLGEFVPGIQRLGLQPSEAWATIYGEYPQIQVGMLAPSLDTAQHAINSDGWRDLHDKLFAFVQNYNCKIVPARGGFQF